MSGIRRSVTLGDSSQGTQMVNAHLGRRRKPKGDRTRRSWTDREEETLVVWLKELSVTGWKSDNGFRAGYLMKLEDAMKQQFPNTDIKGTPHINSKITAWKRLYSSLVSILGRSGVGFNNNNDYKIDCDDDQWEQIVKADPHARFMRGKSWPYFEYWQVIFGKDRADGTFSEELMDAANLLSGRNTVRSSPSEEFDHSMGLEDENPFVTPTGTVPPEGVADSTGQSTHQTTSSNATGKKRKNDDGLGGLIEMLGKMQDDTNARLECLSLRIGYEFDLSKARKEVYDLLGRLPLTRDEKFDVGEIILEKVQRLDFFLGMPEEDRFAYAIRILAKYG